MPEPAGFSRFLPAMVELYRALREGASVGGIALTDPTAPTAIEGLQSLNRPVFQKRVSVGLPRMGCAVSMESLFIQ